jgi:hypothetical protein
MDDRPRKIRRLVLPFSGYYIDATSLYRQDNDAKVLLSHLHNPRQRRRTRQRLLDRSTETALELIPELPIESLLQVEGVLSQDASAIFLVKVDLLIVRKCSEDYKNFTH